MRGIDATLFPIDGGLYDIGIQFDGDIETKDSFDTFIQVALLTDARADASEMRISHRRRGWIGNEHTPDFEIGSKLWLYEQARLTRTTMNEIETEAVRALQPLVDDNLADAIRGADLIITTTGASLTVDIERDQSEVEKRHFELWNNTGTSSLSSTSSSAAASSYSSGGKSLRFDQDADGLHDATNEAWGIANDYTILIWLKPNSSGTEVGAGVISPGSPVSGAEDAIQLLVDYTGAANQQYRLVLREGNTVFKDYRYGTGILNDTWTLVGFSWNGVSDSLVCFQDGAIVTPGLTPTDNAGTQTDASRDGGLGVNALGALDTCYVGLIHSAMVFNTAISEANITALFNGGNGDGFDPNENSGGYTESSALVQWWLPGTQASPNLGAPATNSPGSVDFTSELGTMDDTHITVDAPKG